MAGIIWWTPARVAALAKLLKGGASYRAAAAELSRRYRRKITMRAARDRALAAGLRSAAKGGRPRVPAARGPSAA